MKYFQNIHFDSLAQVLGILGGIFELLGTILLFIGGIFVGNLRADSIISWILFLSIVEILFAIKVKEEPKIISSFMAINSFLILFSAFFLGFFSISYGIFAILVFIPGLILSTISILASLNIKETGKLNVLDDISKRRYIIRILKILMIPVGVFLLMWLIQLILAFFLLEKIGPAANIDLNTESYNRDIYNCNQKENQYDKNKCFVDLAITRENVSICNEIRDDSNRDYCYASFAVFKKDPSICDTITNVEEKDFCYSRVAIAKQDLSVCDKIQGINRKNFCYSSIAH
ncbi:MAG: hypothetical protein ACPLW7_03930 [Minisyncoccia bacterium]